MNPSEKLQGTELEIQTIRDSAGNGHVASTLRKLISLYDEKVTALEELANEARGASSAFREALAALETKHLSAAVSVQASVLTRLIRFADKPAWECARFVLREAGKEMSASDISSRATELGKDLGKQATAAITNGLKRYIDLGQYFYRRKDGSRFVYGLAEWQSGGTGN
jgi:hypothetical protein